MLFSNYFKLIEPCLHFSYRLVTAKKKYIHFGFIARLLETSRPCLCVAVNTSELCEDAKIEGGNKYQQRNYYRNYLLNNPHYELHQIHSHEEFSNVKSANILKDYYSSENSEVLNELPLILKEELTGLSNNELFYLLHLLGKCSEKNWDLNNWKDFISLLNEELSKRVDSSSFVDIFKFLFLTFESKFHRQLRYYHKAMWKILKKFKHLSPQQMVLMFYLFPKMSSKNEDLKLFVVQNYLFNNISKFTADDIAIISLGFLRMSKAISNSDLISKMINIILSDIESVDSVSFTSFCKILTESASYKKFHAIKEFQEKIIPHAPKLCVSGAVHALLCNVPNNFLNMTLAEIVLKRAKENIDECSLHDIERLTFILSNFNINDEELIALAIQKFELALPNFTLGNTVTAVKFLNNLIHLKVYPQNLLNYVMKRDIVKLLLSKKAFKATIFWTNIHYALEVDKPELCCSEFDDKLRKRFNGLRKDCSDRKEVHGYFKLGFTLAEVLAHVYNDDTFCWIQPLPNFYPLNVIHFNRDLKPERIPDEFKNALKKGHFLKSPDDNCFWISLLLLNAKDFLWNCQEPHFRTKTLLEHFSHFGYSPLVICSNHLKFEIRNGTASNYVKNLLNERLEELSNQEK